MLDSQDLTMERLLDTYLRKRMTGEILRLWKMAMRLSLIFQMGKYQCLCLRKNWKEEERRGYVRR